MKKPIAVFCKEPQVSIYWTLTDFCNFRCNYCPEFLHSGDFHKGRREGFPSEQQINSFLDKLDSLAVTKKLIVILSGGEPTLHPMFSYIVNRLKAINCFVAVNTNGTRDVDFWEDLLPLSSISISLHPEYSKIDKINRISRLIVDSGTPINYNLSCDPNNWDNTVALFESLDDDFKKYVQPKILNLIGAGGDLDRATYQYTSEQSAWIEKINVERPFSAKKGPLTTAFPGSGEVHLIFSDGSSVNANRLAYITMNELHDFEGWRCKAGSESINVHYSGRVFAGVCKAKHLGRIDNFELFEDDIICPRKRCVCPTDLRVNKRR
jgi:MoaA/NifB/PqqE/SkfB family radical SAM enzyme